MALTYHRARLPKFTPTQQQYGIVARQRTSIGFKLALCGDSGAGGTAKTPITYGHVYFTYLLILRVNKRASRVSINGSRASP